MDEQTAHSIELRCSNTDPWEWHWSLVFQNRLIFCCSCNLIGGVKPYQKKTLQKQKLGPKRTGCNCLVQIKMYPHTDTVLGKYNSNYSHPIGRDNLKYVWIQPNTCNLIKDLVRLGLKDKEIVCDPSFENDQSNWLSIEKANVWTVQWR